MRPLKQTRGKPAGKGSHSLLKGPRIGDDKKGKSGKLTSTKNKIRGVERLLRKAGGDNKLKRSLDAKLSELRESLSKHSQEETERKFAVRYHKIRFFERVKLERRLKQLKGKAQRGHALSASEQQQIQNWEQDLQYVLHFPKGERYVSILKEAAEPEAQAKLDGERTRLKTVIKHQRAESAMLTEADEGLDQAEPHAKANSDAEGDTFFLDSQDDQPFEEAAASSAEPAASVAVPRSKRGRTEGGASQEQQGVARQAQTGIAQQTQKGRARQGQKSMPRQARNDAAPQADDATGLITVHDQPPAKRQALASSPQMKKAAAKGVKSSSTADISGLGSAQQSAQHDRPLVLQPSSHATQRSAPAQPMPGPTSSARSNGKLEQSVREIDSARQECDRSRAVLVADKSKAPKVSGVLQAARVPLRSSAASRSQLLLQQLQQKYANSQQLSKPHKGSALPMRAFGRLVRDREQPVNPADICTQPVDVDTPQLSKPVFGKISAMPEVRQTAASTGVMSMRTRAEGGRKRRK